MITVYLPEHYIELIDELVGRGYYGSRCEAVRVAVRDLLMKHGLMMPTGLPGNSGEGPFTCPICGFTSHYLPGIKLHIRQKHFPYLTECPACGWQPGNNTRSCHSAVVRHLIMTARARDPIHAAWAYIWMGSKVEKDVKTFCREMFKRMVSARMEVMI